MQSDLVKLERYVTTPVLYKGPTNSWFIDCRRMKTSFKIKQRGAGVSAVVCQSWGSPLQGGNGGKGSGRCLHTQTHFFRTCEHGYNSLQEMKFHLFENLWSKEPVFFSLPFFPLFSSLPENGRRLYREAHTSADVFFVNQFSMTTMACVLG